MAGRLDGKYKKKRKNVMEMIICDRNENNVANDAEIFWGVKEVVKLLSHMIFQSIDFQSEP